MLDTLTGATRAVKVLAEAGVIRPFRPSRVLRLGHTLLAWGTGPAAGCISLAARFPDEVGLIDDLGELTFGELDARSNALARSLSQRGIGEGDSVALMCRNHRYFVEATFAVCKLGADVLYLNTAFAGPQLAEVLGRERPAAVVVDEEFLGRLEGVDAGVRRILGWVDSDNGSPGDDVDSCEAMAAAGDPQDLRPPARRSRSTILTSGTTGAPKGASRGSADLDAAAALLSRVPLRSRWTTHIAAPLFHTWGWGHFMLSLLLGSTMVLTRRFEPASCMALVEKHRCESLVVIPVMLQRILEAVEPGAPAQTTYDLGRLQVVAASGSALPGDLATRWMDAYGDNLYNTYGSTEVAWATVATPQDLRACPDSAGRPPIGTTVEVLGDDGRPAPAGETGRIFVGNSMLFEGYTGGGSKDVIDGLMATGDVGRYDDQGRLFVEGRDDEMIVSGGENVFPQEVEDALLRHPAVADAAAVGVDDAEFGQRLRAFVVVREGAEVTVDDLRAHVKGLLARYKVPRDVVFVHDLPRNQTGKILKRELAAYDDGDS